MTGYAARMREGETEFEMVWRHVTAGAEHVAKQRALIARLQEAGRPTDKAEALLIHFQDLQRQHEAHLERLCTHQG